MYSFVNKTVIIVSVVSDGTVPLYEKKRKSTRKKSFHNVCLTRSYCSQNNGKKQAL